MPSSLPYCIAHHVELPLKSLPKLQTLQKAAARLVSGTSSVDHITLTL